MGVLVSLLERLNPTHIILGPGPGTPDDSPLTMEFARKALSGELDIPLLGICLGHQAIGVAAGMDLIQTPSGPVHGSPRLVAHDGLGLFNGLASPQLFALYNSLILSAVNGSDLIETSRLEATGNVMGLRHKQALVFGVQFHPESVGSENGIEVLGNFLKMRADA
jgi:anthranilate synthase/aminodeoxychorismate synthase-like glutamine amidotransferase